MRVHAEDPHQRVRAQVKYVRLAACIARDQHAAVAAEGRAQDRIVEPRQRVKNHRALERKEVNLHRRGYRNVVRRLRRELDVRRGLRLEPRGRVSAGKPHLLVSSWTRAQRAEFLSDHLKQDSPESSFWRPRAPFLPSSTSDKSKNRSEKRSSRRVRHRRRRWEPWRWRGMELDRVLAHRRRVARGASESSVR